MRISFDMDGVLADMDAALAKIAGDEFGTKAAAPAASPASPLGLTGTPPSAGPGTGLPAAATLDRLTARQQAKLWKRVSETGNFWEALAELEAGSVRRIQELAYRFRWEVLFVTQRPSTAGRTAQVQTQRWLHKHGYDIPAVYTTRGSRGRIASALSLDVHVDDRLDNAVDIATESRAWSVLVWRDEASIGHIRANAQKMGIAVVGTVGEALDKIVAADQSEQDGRQPAGDEEAAHTGPALLERLRRTFGFGGKN